MSFILRMTSYSTGLGSTFSFFFYSAFGSYMIGHMFPLCETFHMMRQGLFLAPLNLSKVLDVNFRVYFKGVGISSRQHSPVFRICPWWKQTMDHMNPLVC